jgi:hypothetical protein
MNLQLSLTLIIISVAAAFVLRAIVNALRGKGKGSCGPKCGKCVAPQPAVVPGRIALPQVDSRG